MHANELVGGRVLLLLFDYVYSGWRNVLAIGVVVTVGARLPNLDQVVASGGHQVAGLVEAVLLMLLLADHGVALVWRHPPVLARCLEAMQASLVGAVIVIAVLHFDVLVQQLRDARASRVVLDELHVQVRVLRAVQIVSDWRPYRLTSVDIVACTTVITFLSSSFSACFAGTTLVCAGGWLSTDQAAACCEASKAGVQTVLQLIDHAAVHRCRVGASSHDLHGLVLIRKIRVLILEASVFPKS